MSSKRKTELGWNNGVLFNVNGEAWVAFPVAIGEGDSTEAEIWAIHEALKVFKAFFSGLLFIENFCCNQISWINNKKMRPWFYHSISNVLMDLCSSPEV